MNEGGSNMKVIVVGGTAAGLSAASKAKRSKPDLQFKVFERTGYTSYGACGLPYLIEDKVKRPEDLVTLTPDNLTQKRGIPTFIHHEVTALDAAAKQVTVKNLTTGESWEEGYDKLVLATGSSAVLPPIPGIEADNVFVLKSVEDGIAIKAKAVQSKRAIILGGGLIGLEVADGLRSRGLEVTVVEVLPRLLPFLEEAYSQQIADKLLAQGVGLHLGVSIQEVLSQQGAFSGCRLSDGQMLQSDMMVVSAGVRPNSELAKQAGLSLGQRGAIEVDDHMRTSDPDIYACGDCATHFNRLTGQDVYIPLGTTANKQGRVAGANLADGDARFTGIIGSWVTKVFDLFIAGCGMNLQQAREAGYEADSVRIQKDSIANYYPGGGRTTLTLVFDTADGRLLGAQGSGDDSIAGRMNVLVAAVTTGMTVDQLSRLDLVYTPSVAPVYDAILIAAAQAVKKVSGSDD